MVFSVLQNLKEKEENLEHTHIQETKPKNPPPSQKKCHTATINAILQSISVK